MIKLNLPVLFAQKGIRVADADRLTDMGRTTLYRLYNNEVTRIDFASLERLCKLLDCTVSIRPFPIVGIARHEVAAHQYPYLYGLAAV